VELLLNQPHAHSYASPPCVARYSPVFWEPIAGTGERIVALVSLEPHESSTVSVSAGTYCVLPPERLRAMLGRQRGNAAHGVLREVADFMTQRQAAGLPVAELEAPFHGFQVGPAFVARGYAVEQLLDAAVRTVCAFGTSDDLVEEEESRETPRNTVRTAEFIRSLKRIASGDDKDISARFEQTLRVSSSLPDISVDYAYKRWMVQVTSLPATQKQATHALREAQSKLYEIDLLRKTMDGNAIQPVLLINVDILTSSLSEEGKEHAGKMLDRLQQLGEADQLDLMQASDPYDAARLVLALD
jgi:hypothetical protein